ncbi:MAG: twin-arginine translocation signal domain-containing protein, partial [Geodermatophilaceae bacterium]|nr:twin-arginine translocation signal domain-containing protein [Geodermatophilaceae bacterium]
MTTLNRRLFLKAGGATAGAAVLGSSALQTVSMRMATAAPRAESNDA